MTTSPYPVYACEVCRKRIQGMHLMTIRSSWRGCGSPPPDAIVHVCNDRCAKRTPEFPTSRITPRTRNVSTEPARKRGKVCPN